MKALFLLLTGASLLFAQGNIDLQNRPIVYNADGSISTMRSISAEFDGKEYLIPTVSEDGKIMTDKEAIATFRKTGKYLGIFETIDEANKYAKKIHFEQGQLLIKRGIK